MVACADVAVVGHLLQVGTWYSILSSIWVWFIRFRVSVSYFLFFFSSRRRHTRFDCDWSSDVCSSDLRHSHAAWQVDAGANIKVVSDILGHRSSSSTSIYVRVALRRLRTVALSVPR